MAAMRLPVRRRLHRLFDDAAADLDGGRGPAGTEPDARGAAAARDGATDAGAAPAAPTEAPAAALAADYAREDADLGTDPLLEVVQQFPLEAARFIKVVMLLGSAVGVLIALPCGTYLAVKWEACGACNRPLRWWVLVHCALQLLQVPIRLNFVRRLCQVEQRAGSVEDFLLRLTHSPAWRRSKVLSVATYGWFILGVVWLMNSSYCPSCPGLYRLALSVMLITVARLVVTMLAFRRTFPGQLAAEAAQPRRPRGASQKLIDNLPACRCTAEDLADAASTSRTSCAVCLSDFEIDESLRRLPCSHMFHTACIDRWLRRNKVCPLCLQDIEEPPPPMLGMWGGSPKVR